MTLILNWVGFSLVHCDGRHGELMILIIPCEGDTQGLTLHALINLDIWYLTEFFRNDI